MIINFDEEEEAREVAALAAPPVPVKPAYPSEWTPETSCTRTPEVWPIRLDPEDNRYTLTVRRLNDAAIYAVLHETSWVPQQELSINPAITDQVARLERPCPICGSQCGSGCEVLMLHIGADRKFPARRAVSCPCSALRRMWAKWTEFVDRDYWECDLRTITPSTASSLDLGKQQAVINTLRADPTGSYLFCGASSTGKTYLAYSLFRLAVVSHVDQMIRTGDWASGPWACSVPTLIEQLFTYRTQDGDPPIVTAEKINAVARNGFRPVLMLDELDKWGFSESRAMYLGELISRVDAQGGQLIATSNASYEQLAAKWGPSIGEPILRRIALGKRGHLIDFDRM